MCYCKRSKRCRVIRGCIQASLVFTIALCVVGNAGYGQETIDAQSLRAPLEDVVRRIQHCYTVAVNRGDQTSFIIPEGVRVVKQRTRRSVHRVWLSGDSLKFESQSEAMWDGEWRNIKLSEFDADVTTCLRPDSEFVCADIRPYSQSRARSWQHRGLYTKRRNYDERLHFYLPLLDLHRKWATTPQTWFAINDVYLSKLEDWQIVSSDTRGVSAEVVVDIVDGPELVYVPAKDPDRGELREGDELFVIPITRVTFSRHQNGKHYPTRIVNHRKWRFRGQEHEVDEIEDTCVVLFQAMNWTEFGDGLVFPKYGIQETFSRGNHEYLDLNGFCRTVIDCILSDKKLKPKEGGNLLETRREWYIHSLKSIEPQESLWIEPMRGFCVFDPDTGERVISGVPKSLSDRIVKGVRWLRFHGHDNTYRLRAGKVLQESLDGKE